jgi:hypothetical protein
MVIDCLHKYIRQAAGAALAVLLLAAPTKLVFAQEPAINALPFSRGEELVYRAEFSRGLLRGVDVAEFRFKANTEHVSAPKGATGDPVTISLMGDVVSKGLFVRVAGFHFHQHVESIVDPNPFAALRTSKLYEQGKRTRLSEAVFDHQARRVTWSERDPNQTGAPAITTLDFSEPIQDVLTVIYFLRTQRLEVGKSLDIPLTDSGRVFRMSVAVVERKRIDTVLGRVNAFRVEPAMFGAANLSRSRGQLSIWITDDDRHLPVKAQLKVEIGTFDIKLKRLSFPETRQAR